jgi:alpha-beta hydrolase superfamily lysophospholipase
VFSWIAWIAGVVGVGYVAAVLLVWRYQERIVFQPPRILADEDASAQRVEYPAADCTSIFAYVVGDVRHAPAIMLAFHGNADLARWFVPWAQRVVASTGAAVVLPEYRGYAGLQGSPSYESARQDARSCLEFVRDTLGIPASRLVYFGHSLGSAIATELAVESAPRPLILQSPFPGSRCFGQCSPAYSTTRSIRCMRSLPPCGWLTVSTTA